MNRLAAIVALTALSCSALAHPGSGIAVGPDGAVYFADVGRTTIWRLEPGGAPEAFIEDRWTHSLEVTADGTLYYEREHPANGPAPASFWRVRAGGEHEMLIGPQSDRREFSGGVFALDPSGNVYYPHSVRGEDGVWRALLMKRTPEGEVSEFTGLGDGPPFTDGAADEATIRIVTSMASAPDGSVYFADRDHIRRVETSGEGAGRVTTIAAGLIDARPVDPPERRGPETTINRLYGLTVTAGGECFVAYKAGRRVVRVSAAGEKATVYASPRGWSPVGVTTHGEGVYVLEVADRDIEKLRVLKVAEGGEAEVVAELG